MRRDASASYRGAAGIYGTKSYRGSRPKLCLRSPGAGTILSGTRDLLALTLEMEDYDYDDDYDYDYADEAIEIDQVGPGTAEECEVSHSSGLTTGEMSSHTEAAPIPAHIPNGSEGFTSDQGDRTTRTRPESANANTSRVGFRQEEHAPVAAISAPELLDARHSKIFASND